MKIVAALPWYDEPVAFLDRCVRSLAGVVDELVALDGRWQHFADGDPVLSHWTQAEAIDVAAKAIELETRIVMGSHVWESQVEKRAALMQECTDRGADWIFVIDADEYVAGHQAAALRSALKAEIEYDVAIVLASDLSRRMPQRKMRRIFRRGTTVTTAHNGYNLAGKWLHGDPARVKLEPALDCSALLHIHDDYGARGVDRLEQKREYRTTRNRLRLEAWR